MHLDPAVARALSLDPNTTTLSRHGGSNFTSTSKITAPSISSSLSGPREESTTSPRQYFLKTATERDAALMFAGEHESLNALHRAVPNICPQSHAHGKLDEGGNYAAFLVTDFLDMSSQSFSPVPRRSPRMSLAQKLAKLHTTPAPIPEGYTKPQFGFPVPTCCGDTVQDNTYNSSWAEFFAHRRLLAILKQGEKSQGQDHALRALVEECVDKVLPRLIGDMHLNHGKGVMPVVVHGDLWSGNHGVGRLSINASSNSGVGQDTTSDEDAGREQSSAKTVDEPEEVVFDPSSCYAHNEYELGIMKMFGGFGSSFFTEYHKICPKTEPIEEYDDRVALYESYHHLNHYAIFGGTYKIGASTILRRLLQKYGR